MIHPFARFGAAPAAGETLAERAAALQKPVAEFAAFLGAGKSPQAADSPLAASGTSTTRSAVLGGSSPAVHNAASRADSNSQPAPATSSPSPGPAQAEIWVARQAAVPESDGDPPTAAAEGPPRFADVPDSAKYPAGPYRQAPPEFGGEWWLVSPFTGEEPWVTQGVSDAPAASPVSKYATESLPEDFLQAFGEMPVRRAGEAGADFAGRLARWKQDLEYFQRIGIPDGFDEAQVEAAASAYEQWGMGRPVFYEGRYGWFARFPDSAIPEFEMDAASAVGTSHLAIARFQVRLLQQGAEPPTPHPFVPPHLLEQQA